MSASRAGAQSPARDTGPDTESGVSARAGCAAAVATCALQIWKVLKPFQASKEK